MNRYIVFKEVTFRKHFPVSFGILFTPDVNSRDGNSVIWISDITVDYTKIAALVELCNRLDLSPDHLWDVVEDFTADL